MYLRTQSGATRIVGIDQKKTLGEAQGRLGCRALFRRLITQYCWRFESFKAAGPGPERRRGVRRFGQTSWS